MASIYRKGEGDVIWLRYKDPVKGWKGKPTGYRWSNFGDVRQAKILARKQTEREQERAQITGSSKPWEWVHPWLTMRYGGQENTTLDRYIRSWRNLTKYLSIANLGSEPQISREFIANFMAWRTQSVGRNTAIGEIKLMAMIMDEAVARHLASVNPLRRAGLKKESTKEKELWEDEHVFRAVAHLEKHSPRWERAAFYFGFYQACRLRQCQLPLANILLDQGLIRYPDRLVKGRSGFTQPIDPNFIPILEKLIFETKKAKESVICEIPWDASLRFRRTFDRAGLPNHCHHGLRATWITRAADRGVTEAEAMAFCHHESREVHRIYKKLKAVATSHVPAALALPSLSQFSSGSGV